MGKLLLASCGGASMTRPSVTAWPTIMASVSGPRACGLDLRCRFLSSPPSTAEAWVPPPLLIDLPLPTSGSSKLGSPSSTPT